jgi:hypothetical protein
VAVRLTTLLLAPYSEDWVSRLSLNSTVWGSVIFSRCDLFKACQTGTAKDPRLHVHCPFTLPSCEVSDAAVPS